MSGDSAVNSAGKAASVRRRRHLRRLLVALAILVLVGAAVELLARYRLGLGDPPLVQIDPEIEYLHVPSTHYLRFGNRVQFNQWSMRSDDFPARKRTPDEFRLLVIGDSIINGGAQTDQSELATSILQSKLADSLRRPVVVGNISAGSWGPPNMLAYVRRFGLLEADAVVIVLSSHDAADVPTFGPLDVNFPQRRPRLATQEAVQRYLPRYLPKWLVSDSEEPPRSVEQQRIDEQASMDALRALLELAADSGARVLLLQHLEQGELSGSPQPGHASIAAVAAEMKIPTRQLGPAFAEALAQGVNPYRDPIHPNAAGQRIVAEVIYQWIAAP